MIQDMRSSIFSKKPIPKNNTKNKSIEIINTGKNKLSPPVHLFKCTEQAIFSQSEKTERFMKTSFQFRCSNHTSLNRQEAIENNLYLNNMDILSFR